MGMKYICEDCGCILDEEWVVFQEDRDTGYKWIECPHCKSDDLSEAHECRECGKVVRDEDLCEGVCEDCFEEAVEDEEYAVDYIASNLDDFWELMKSNYTEHVLAKMFYAEFKEDVEDFIKEEPDDFVWHTFGKWI